jgi:hypothetical protein
VKNLVKISLKEYNLQTITIFQTSFALIISLIFQFVIPFSWQPLDTFLYGVQQHGDPGTNIVIFTLSQWYFSFSLAWLLYRDNMYINNFLIYSIVPLGIIVFYEFFFLFLYYDYIHIIPVLVSIYLIWRKRDTLLQKYAFYIILINISWLLSVYFLNLAYYNEDLIIYIRNLVIYLGLWIILSFVFKAKKGNEKNII